VAYSAAKKQLEVHDESFRSLPFDLYVSGIEAEAAITLGEYTLVDKSILTYFAYTGSGARIVRAHLLYFEKYIEKLPLMYGLREATLEELLAFGIQYPNVQRHFPIAALGSERKIGQGPGVWNVPYLAGDMKERRLCLGASRFGWSDVFRFLVIEI